MGADEKVGTKCGGSSAGTCVTRDTSIDDHQVTSRGDDSDMQQKSNWHELLELLSGLPVRGACSGACWGRAQRMKYGPVCIRPWHEAESGPQSLRSQGCTSITLLSARILRRDFEAAGGGAKRIFGLAHEHVKLSPG